MLIVPAEHRFDLARLPWATIFLALACLAVFFGYQSGDDARLGAAVDVYRQEGVLEHERALLEAFQQARGGALDDDALIAAALHPDFGATVHAYWNANAVSADWMVGRTRFEAARDRVSALRFGLAPAVPKPAALLAHMFLHGGVAHLAGNLVFLLLFGMLLERLLGSALFLATWLLTGLAAAGVFMLANPASHVPMIGASGAISGLMGAYLGVYRLRKVRFFYTLGFWFGEFTAPALLVFPLWLGKELYGWYAGADAVAYAAHAGGLLGGLAIALLLHRQAAGTLDTDEASRRTTTERRETLARIGQLLTDLRIDDALRAAEQAIRRSPGEAAYWNVYAEAAQRLVPGPEHDRAVAMLFMNAAHKAMTPDFLRRVLGHYQERSPGGRALHGKGGAALARRFFREGCLRDADQLLDAQFRANALSADYAELLIAMTDIARKNNDRRRLQRYEQYRAAFAGAATQAVADPS